MSIECSSCVYSGHGTEPVTNCKDGQTPSIDGHCQSYKPNLAIRFISKVKREIEGLQKPIPLRIDYDLDDIVDL